MIKVKLCSLITGLTIFYFFAVFFNFSITSKQKFTACHVKAKGEDCSRVQLDSRGEKIPFQFKFADNPPVPLANFSASIHGQYGQLTKPYEMGCM
jgi:hypothetical protein